MISDPRPEELIHAEELMHNAKVEEAVEIVANFEKKGGISSKEQLWALLLRGGVNGYKLRVYQSVELGNQAYLISQELELVPERIEALLLKVYCVFLGRIDEANDYIGEAERLLSETTTHPPYNYSTIKEHHLLLKSWVYDHQGDYNTALRLAEEGLSLAEKSGRKLRLGVFLQLMCNIYQGKGDQEKAIEYAMKTIEVMKNLNFQIGIANGFMLLGHSYYAIGNINQALVVIQEGLSIEEISAWGKVRSLFILGEIFQIKGLLDISLETYKKGLNLAERISHFIYIGLILNGIGKIYRQKGDIDQAKKYYEQSLTYLEEKRWTPGVLLPTYYLFIMNLDENSHEQAKYYLSKLRELADQDKNKHTQQAYQLGKALMLRATKRMRDNVEAEGLLKQIVDNEIVNVNLHILALISLSDLYLEELSMYNNQVILEEISPLLTKLLGMAEEENSILWLAEGKLAQAKLSLIQMDLDNAQILLTQAQQFAEEHGLELLARKISSEHDLLLEKIDEWDRLKKEDAPMADRIELASFDGVINRLQEKQAVKPPELVDEEPILLLIMDTSGATYFNHPFAANWDHSDLFSSFMSAFNTFSDEIFSKSIDRIRIGENTILINPVESFLACYVIKGQSYPALQKLTRFTEAIKETPEIWRALNKSVKTSEMLELNNPAALKTVINEIFS